MNFMPKSGPELRHTAMGSAMRKAGVLSPRMRLEEAARKALTRHGWKYEAARADFLTAARGDVALLWALFAEELFADEFDIRTFAYLRRIKESPDAERRDETVGREPDRASGAVRTGSASNAGPIAPDRPTIKPAAAHAPRAPAPQYVTPKRRPGENRNPNLRMPESKLEAWKPELVAEVEAERQKSKLYTFKINGRPMAEVTAKEARAWTAAQSRNAYFVTLVIEGVQDGMQIGEAYKRDAWREVEEKYRRAEKSDRA